MAQYVAFNQRVEFIGQSALSILAAMGDYADIGQKILAQHGLKKVLPAEWYPQQPYLDAYRTMAGALGANTLFAIGKKIPEFALWPPDITTIEAGLAAIDVAYHMNHRLDGQQMFNEATGVMIEGIGHYRIAAQGRRQITMVCNNPYPSDFDRGLVLGVARRWKPLAEVIHDESQPSRKQGADSCTYIVKW